MAQEDQLPADGSCGHAAGDALRLLGRNTRCAGRCCAGSGNRSRLLGDCGAAGDHGRGRAASAVSGRMVARHHFLFLGHVLFFQNADVRKSPATQRMKMSARRRLQVLLSMDLNEISSTISVASYALPFLQLLLELLPDAQWARGKEKR